MKTLVPLCDPFSLNARPKLEDFLIKRVTNTRQVNHTSVFDSKSSVFSAHLTRYVTLVGRGRRELEK